MVLCEVGIDKMDGILKNKSYGIPMWIFTTFTSHHLYHILRTFKRFKYVFDVNEIDKISYGKLLDRLHYPANI